MRSLTERNVMPYGAAALAVLVALLLASFNLSKMPGFAGDTYQAAFSDAGGIKPGDGVQVAGVDVGRVDEVEIDGDHVVVHFEVTGPAEFGPRSGASVEVLNLLGEKYLELHPAGGGQMEEDATIPMSRTESAYDIVHTLGDLTSRTQQIDTDQLAGALDTLSDTFRGSTDEVRGSLQGLSRLSRTIAGRDAELQTLLDRAHETAQILDSRKGQLTTLMRDGEMLLAELRARREVIHGLLVGADELSRQLTGLVRENEDELEPALRQIETVTQLLQDNRRQIDATIRALEPYALILMDIVGSGPWFDAWLYNVGGPDFQPGRPPEGER
ncbi:MAG TPA: MlaD family protein [Nocardioidaceae bacterium]|nr:MlaD family protein [Nocardioidaceae bacterium]